MYIYVYIYIYIYIYIYTYIHIYIYVYIQQDPLTSELEDTGKVRTEKALVFHVGTVYHLEVAITADRNGKPVAFDGAAG